MNWWVKYPEIFRAEQQAVRKLLDANHARFSIDSYNRMVLTFTLSVAGCEMTFYSFYPDNYPCAENGNPYGGLFTVPYIGINGLLNLARDCGWNEMANLAYPSYDRHIIQENNGDTRLCLGDVRSNMIYSVPLYSHYTSNPNELRSMTGSEAIQYTNKWWMAFVVCLHDTPPYYARRKFGAGPF